ncbi:host attachment protein [Leptolyngbya cf. ectocarpi LEGE 11479]|uniref:Host attachment protein n=1 Tax=Leptolyngbya cf. ectocarpi LEGE 11479 TaxID=1828722 RepID=A0A929A0C6_LEPEC|nr:host attachment protein [Leptolyngbya ectocarpi]MBE9070691.1 host attachment protein [Leptolyngbya cf. ectocarpi LEGE 11479]
MSKFLVATINGAVARFFTLEPAPLPVPDPEHLTLVEHKGITSSEGELPGKALWSNIQSGRNRGASGQSHRYDDHRQSHKIEFERRFAKSIAKTLLDLAEAQHVQQLIIIAAPQILGLMREVCMPLLPKPLKMNELARDLCHLKPHELHDYLAKIRQLPVRIRL